MKKAVIVVVSVLAVVAVAWPAITWLRQRAAVMEKLEKTRRDAAWALSSPEPYFRTTGVRISQVLARSNYASLRQPVIAAAMQHESYIAVYWIEAEPTPDAIEVAGIGGRSTVVPIASCYIDGAKRESKDTVLYYAIIPVGDMLDTVTGDQHLTVWLLRKGRRVSQAERVLLKAEYSSTRRASP